jgi:2-dehydropantoate 2-reductase
VSEYRHAIVGAGAVGTMLAWALTQNGVPFAWVVRNPQRRLNLDPLHVFTDNPRHPGARAITTVMDSALALRFERLDWLILAVKAQQVEPVRAALPPFPAERTLVVANGLHEGPFILGALYGGARLDVHGFLHTCDENTLRLGALGLLHPAPQTLEQLAGELAAKQLQPVVLPDMHDEMWRKAALNCVINPLTALLNCENGGLLWMLESPLIAGLLAETAEVMLAEGVALPGAGTARLQEDLRALVQATAGNSSSMREDFAARRETEIARLNLAVVEYGRRHGLDCPLNAALGRMVSFLTNRGAL